MQMQICCFTASLMYISNASTCDICRVTVTSASRKMNQSIVGREGQVTQVLSNGWVNIFIPSLKVNEHVQQRYLAHTVPGRMLQSSSSQLATQSKAQVPQQPTTAAVNDAALSIVDFPELPQDLDLMSNLDGDLFGDHAHASTLGKQGLLGAFRCVKHQPLVRICSDAKTLTKPDPGPSSACFAQHHMHLIIMLRCVLCICQQLK